MPCVVQMHGEPGAGKSTLAREIGRELHAAVLELDIITSALQVAGVHSGGEGEVAYGVLYALAESILRQGRSVVLDNPVFRESVEAKSKALAALGYWHMIECICGDSRMRRLSKRERLPVQTTSLGSWWQRPGTSEPRSLRLVVDTSAPLQECVAKAIAYLTAIEPDL